MKFNPSYAVAAGIVFAVEVLIGLFVHDQLIRPYIGDSLAVVLVYLGLRAITPWRVVPALEVALLIAAAIEFGQMFHLIALLGLRHNVAARFILGGAFDVKDFAAYFAGAFFVLVVEAVRKQRWV